MQVMQAETRVCMRSNYPCVIWCVVVSMLHEHFSSPVEILSLQNGPASATVWSGNVGAGVYQTTLHRQKVKQMRIKISVNVLRDLRPGIHHQSVRSV